MTTPLRPIVANDLVQDGSGVWVLREREHFAYSDGAESERYLERVLRNATDLSSGSRELQSRIKDWPSEYHLSPKRAQLLSGFTFDRSASVLEVGCGCGAITRLLGETFDRVVAVEGSINRARLARLRTRDLENVSIMCAPFQTIAFTQKFDIVVCVGVYEYSAAFVEGDNPYDAVLRYFRDLLTPDGIVIIAIENQFGLKYFGSSGEDHLDVMFEGLEGYHAGEGHVRTFGRAELESNLTKYFPTVRFYYPYPDYKLPDCVITDEFLSQGHAGELVSQMKSRDHVGDRRPLFDEGPVTLELARNRMLPFFANSFLVLAGNGAGAANRAAFDQLAVIFSSGRAKRFETRTRIVRRSDGRIIASKRSVHGAEDGASPLTLADVDSRWIDGLSLHTVVSLRCRSSTDSLDTMFEPCRAWVSLLEGLSAPQGNEKRVGGEHVDLIWSNAYPEAGGFAIVDKEWAWRDPIPLNVLVIRAIYAFLLKTEGAPGLSRKLGGRSGKRLIRAIAGAIGVKLSNADFTHFIDLESRFLSLVNGMSATRSRLALRWYLFDRASLLFVRGKRGKLRRITARIMGRLKVAAES